MITGISHDIGKEEEKRREREKKKEEKNIKRKKGNWKDKDK